MKIIFSGGGTLGPVVPLLAVAEAFKKKYPQTQFVWVGTSSGPERQLIEESHIPFFVIGAGKWRRYFSFWNITDTFKIFIAFFQSLILLIIERPDIVISAGGFVSVPLHWAAAFLGIRSWVHQQDARIGLANKLMFPFATKVTTALASTAQALTKYHAEWIGNPSRDLSVQDVAASRRRFGIPEGAPVLFALGGGTGSASLNKMILDALPHLPPDWHVIHLVGKERPSEMARHAAGLFPNYHAYDFFTDGMKDAYAVADIVIARAGFATLTELASLSCAAVILPMFDTHQEENARAFASHGGIIMLERDSAEGIKLAQILKDLMSDTARRKSLGKQLHVLLPRADQARIVSLLNQVVSREKA